MDRGRGHARSHPALPEGRLTIPAFPSSASTARPVDAEDLQLPKPPGFIRSWLARHPWLLDGFIAGGYAVPMASVTFIAFIASLFGSQPFGADLLRSSPAYWLLAFYVTCAVTVALLFRRHVPVISAAIIAGSLLISTMSSLQLDGVPMMFALYALAVYRSSRSAWLFTAIGAGSGCLSLVISDPGDLAGIIGYTVLFSLLLVISTLVGITFGNRRRYIAALLDRAEQLARERDQRAQLAAAAERARIAREMHDIVAHSLTVIVALSDGAEASIDRSPESAREAVRQTGITARRALTDMRRSLGVLTESTDDQADTADRAAPAPLTPQPGTADLAEMIESYRVAGLPVRYTTSGEPPADPVLQLTVFRVVQESLTNALRYALQPSKVDVVIAFGHDGIDVEVADDGVDPARGARSTGSGRGLIGMRERVGLHGGTVTVGPAGSRGWRVRAHLRSGEGTPSPEGAAPADGLAPATGTDAPGTAADTTPRPEETTP